MTRRTTLVGTRRGFTLAELLVVMGIIAILGVLTAVSVQRISRDSRVASATNTVTAALGAARAVAIKENAVVVVVFRPVWDPTNRQRPQQTELVIAKWTGEARLHRRSGDRPEGCRRSVRSVSGIQPLRLPPGIRWRVRCSRTACPTTCGSPRARCRRSPNGVCKGSIVYSRMVAVMLPFRLARRNPNCELG